MDNQAAMPFHVSSVLPIKVDGVGVEGEGAKVEEERT